MIFHKDLKNLEMIYFLAVFLEDLKGIKLNNNGFVFKPSNQSQDSLYISLIKDVS